ncbi:MAG: HAD hydrolase-like protein [Pseudomonadales bacterium]|jgi:phosphoglycolate phosphatase|nr:HAD hydrolase-like protein [Pseudomonadales bacterium]
MRCDNLIFDLDGTISDPSVGISRSINYALLHHGFQACSREQISNLIGLPLDQMYHRLATDVDERQIPSMVDKYRERYLEIGFSENVLYDGMREVIDELHELRSCNLGICTSKRNDVAEKVLQMFDLTDNFGFVSGGDIGISKSQQIAALLASSAITGRSMMIGDRSVDILAAHSNGLQSTGVLWGYGSRCELEEANAGHLSDAPAELLEYLNSQAI